MKSQVVVLRVVYDDELEDPAFGDGRRTDPANWKWSELADDQCEVIGWGPIKEET